MRPACWPPWSRAGTPSCPDRTAPTAGTPSSRRRPHGSLNRSLPRLDLPSSAGSGPASHAGRSTGRGCLGCVNWTRSPGPRCGYRDAPGFVTNGMRGGSDPCRCEEARARPRRLARSRVRFRRSQPWQRPASEARIPLHPRRRRWALPTCVRADPFRQDTICAAFLTAVGSSSPATAFRSTRSRPAMRRTTPSQPRSGADSSESGATHITTKPRCPRQDGTLQPDDAEVPGLPRAPGAVAPTGPCSWARRRISSNTERLMPYRAGPCSPTARGQARGSDPCSKRTRWEAPTMP